ncbi:MAG: undecaprenyl-diphosphate phosphatase [Alphaproteobacteria bacterium]|nr:undecaprenyl-diphosphate phosphatase [Alphaproteobacteria bacterium]
MADAGSDTLGAVVLGAIQGLTEFLPVSSSGHLAVFQQFIDVRGDDVLFDLALHVGTLLPAIWFYRADILGVLKDVFAGQGPFRERPGVRLAMLVIVATIPTGVIGLSMEDLFEGLFQKPAAIAIAFVATGMMLWSTRGRDSGRLDVMTTPLASAFFIGIAQGVAITPGVSRSGTTIAIALLLGLERGFAVKLSFLMSIPAIVGALLVRSRHADLSVVDPLQLGVGAVTAMVTGYLALVLLVRLVLRGRFADFAWYVWGAAVVTMGLVLTGAA